MTGLGTLVGVTAGYSGTPLAQKLGIKPGSRLLLLGAPAGFVPQPLPDDVTVHHRRGAGHYDVALLFCPEARRLHEGSPGSLPRSPQRALLRWSSLRVGTMVG